MKLIMLLALAYTASSIGMNSNKPTSDDLLEFFNNKETREAIKKHPLWETVRNDGFLTISLLCHNNKNLKPHEVNKEIDRTIAIRQNIINDKNVIQFLRGKGKE